MARSSVQEIHALLGLCKYSQISNLFRWYRGACMRTRDAADAELTALRYAMQASKDGRVWRSEFLDFLGIALGLLQEAAITLDSKGVSVWRDFLLSGELSFTSWPHCSNQVQQEMDELVHSFALSTPTARMDIPKAAMIHMANRVVDLRSAVPGKSPISLEVGASLYLTFRNGGLPTTKALGVAVVLALARLRLPGTRDLKTLVKRGRKIS